MNINIAVIDRSFRNRRRSPAAVSALHDVARTPRHTLACTWVHDPATGRLTCSWGQSAAEKSEQTSPRSTGPRPSPHAAPGPVPLAA